ncbi:peptide-methionine (S)-S-oxide reductase MsrA [Sphingobacterium daejeonense]|uniref:peptide-methionine (S)-S-oxide reductase MsrA n=1 Tax=Sphingobacterium daejeonense TaxID=371142 RepID=UPI0021A82983|nr:peptide-methionine (S)-S-oxide reductase MsrA [Sphingobacterium daejeonense]MCT1530932.1 peptide-methionine (S)-S-oxide reductase MsrA [Sphingobacterium daejeonense]
MRNLAIIGSIFLIVVIIMTMGFSYQDKQELKQTENQKTMSLTGNENEIYFAGGCFWGTEHFFKLVRGVVGTEVGYANATKANPTYEEVCTGQTGATETVKVIYDPEVIDLGLLIDLYFETIDPTLLNQQGNDRGTQYRTGIYYTDNSVAELVKDKLHELSLRVQAPVVVENEPLKNFYDAETYHQDYLDKNPGGYCHIGAHEFELAKKANPEK